MNEEEVIDLMPARKADPVDNLRRFLTLNFCEPHPHNNNAHPLPPPRLRSATMESHASVGSSEVEKDGMEQIIKNAKAALDNFWNEAMHSNKKSPAGGEVPTEIIPGEETLASQSKTKSISRGINIEHVVHEEEKEATKASWSVVVTEPGTGRAIRVFRGLELFILTVFVLTMTFMLLGRMGVHLDFVLESKETEL